MGLVTPLAPPLSPPLPPPPLISCVGGGAVADPGSCPRIGGPMSRMRVARVDGEAPRTALPTGLGSSEAFELPPLTPPPALPDGPAAGADGGPAAAAIPAVNVGVPRAAGSEGGGVRLVAREPTRELDVNSLVMPAPSPRRLLITEPGPLLSRRGARRDGWRGMPEPAAADRADALGPALPGGSCVGHMKGGCKGGGGQPDGQQHHSNCSSSMRIPAAWGHAAARSLCRPPLTPGSGPAACA